MHVLFVALYSNDGYIPTLERAVHHFDGDGLFILFIITLLPKKDCLPCYLSCSVSKNNVENCLLDMFEYPMESPFYLLLYFMISHKTETLQEINNV